MAERKIVKTGSDVTLLRFDEVLRESKELFSDKSVDYGPTWIAFRWVSLVDQMWIKARRIRTLEEMEDQSLIPEGRDAEYIGLINYAVIGLMRWWFAEQLPSSNAVVSAGELPSLTPDALRRLYDLVVGRVRGLLRRKNHDYGQAWQHMHLKSITDQIIVKILRMKTILGHSGELRVSENLDGHFCDILNYSVLALIQLRKYVSSMRVEDVDSYCRFCAPPDDERIVCREPPFYGMLSLGPLVFGHLLIVYDKHLPCFGEMSNVGLRQFGGFCDRVCCVLKGAFPSHRIVKMEHGNRVGGAGAAAYERHAHMHFLHMDRASVAIGECIAEERGCEAQPVKSFSEFASGHKRTDRGEPYLYVEEDGDGGVFRLGSDALGPHYLRRMFMRAAEHVSANDDWLSAPDWPRVLEARALLLPRFSKLRRRGPSLPL